MSGPAKYQTKQQQWRTIQKISDYYKNALTGGKTVQTDQVKLPASCRVLTTKRPINPLTDGNYKSYASSERPFVTRNLNLWNDLRRPEKSLFISSKQLLSMGHRLQMKKLRQKEATAIANERLCKCENTNAKYPTQTLNLGASSKALKCNIENQLDNKARYLFYNHNQKNDMIAASQQVASHRQQGKAAGALEQDARQLAKTADARKYNATNDMRYLSNKQLQLENNASAARKNDVGDSKTIASRGKGNLAASKYSKQHEMRQQMANQRQSFQRYSSDGKPLFYINGEKVTGAADAADKSLKWRQHSAKSSTLAKVKPMPKMLANQLNMKQPSNASQTTADDSRINKNNKTAKARTAKNGKLAANKSAVGLKTNKKKQTRASIYETAVKETFGPTSKRKSINRTSISVSANRRKSTNKMGNLGLSIPSDMTLASAKRDKAMYKYSAQKPTDSRPTFLQSTPMMPKPPKPAYMAETEKHIDTSHLKFKKDEQSFNLRSARRKEAQATQK